jgi:hypothetical protein
MNGWRPLDFARPGDVMEHYRAYTIGWDGHILSAIDLHCADDDAAKERARQLVDGHDIELWQGGRQVAVFESPEK